MFGKQKQSYQNFNIKNGNLNSLFENILLRCALLNITMIYLSQFLFVLVNRVKSNEKSLSYFSLMSRDLCRVGIYDGVSDMKWLMPEGEISTHL